MGGGGKGGSSDQSGMYAAMASAEAADKAYALGEQQFQWSQQVWNQEQPLMDASEQAQIALATQQTKSLQQMMNETAQQWDTYEQNYLPEELKYIGQVNDWASPGNQALVRGQAMGSIGEMGQAGLNTAAETLRGYGINPSSPRYASLYTSAQPMLGAAEAAAGTSASQNLKLQQLGLESGVINTGRGMVNATGALTTAGTGAGAAGAGAAQGAGQTAMSNLSGTGVGAGATSELFNAGSNAMSQYVNAVNGYNQTQADFAQSNAQEMSGFGSALGSVLGLGFMGKFAKGGAVAYDDGGAVGGAKRAIPSPPIYLTRDNAIANLKMMMPPPGYSEGGGGEAAGEPNKNIPGGNIGGTHGYQQSWTGDRGNVARPPAPPPYLSPRAPISPQGPPPIDLEKYHSPQARSGYGEDNTKFDPSSNPSGFLTGEQYRAIPQSVPQPVRIYMGNNPTTGAAMGGPIGYDTGAMVGSDPQMTPDQGGGATGIPSQPMPPAQQPPGLPSDATPGGGVPAYASPSGGATTDDVDAKLTAGEFVIPKDVAMWKGHEYFAKQLDAARAGQQKFAQRDDVGGEPTGAIPRMPTFVSRPAHMGMTMGAIPGMAAG